MTPRVSIPFFVVAMCLPALCFAASNADTVKNNNDDFQIQFLKRQVDQNMSIGRAIRSIASHYPQDVVSIVDVALDTYPDKYREIIFAAISAQPASTQDIVQMAIEKDVSTCTNIVKLAIRAEPSYVDFVVQAAADTTPEELDEIVRVAVQTEPDSADRIVQTLSQEHPNKVIEILSTALNTVPYVGEYVVDALLAVFPTQSDEVITTALQQTHAEKEQAIRILETAQSYGVSDEKLAEYGQSIGLTVEDIQLVLNR